MTRPSKDYTGKKFGKLKVIRKTTKKDKRGNYLWECQCDCGNICYIIGSKLQYRQSCGCLTDGIDIDFYIGKNINGWYIKNKLYNTKKGWMMECKCLNCDNLVLGVNIYNIIKGQSTNCGCVRKEKLAANRVHTVESLQQRKFGKLTVVEEAGRDSYGKLLYKCHCDCGNETIVLGRSLLNYTTTSCGCISSKNNSYINQFITNLGYDTICEKSVMINTEEYTGRLRFDIFIPQLNLAIEYDGEGHFIPIDWAGKGTEWAQDALLATQRRDEIKNQYCYEHGINLLRISYLESDNIEEIIINKINEITNND